MRIVSYNLNGIRSALSKGLGDWLTDINPDIFCVQETKAQPEQIDIAYFESLGYQSFWHSAIKKGYSGVGILCKFRPDDVVYGCGIDYIDQEGRVIRADFGGLSILSIYFPSGSSGDERQEVKMRFLKDINDYIQELKQTRTHLVIAGDYNICHQAIDIHDPIRNAQSSGFLPEERAWMDQFLARGFLDSFRERNKEPHAYSWWSFRANARNNNKGWRIDYQMISENLKNEIKFSDLLPEAKHSDHCPTLLELSKF